MADSDGAEELVSPAQVLKALGRGGDLQELGLGDELPHHHITCQGAGGVLEGHRRVRSSPCGMGRRMILSWAAAVDLTSGKASAGNGDTCGAALSATTVPRESRTERPVR